MGHGFRNSHAITALFEMLDRDHDHRVTADETGFLDRWKFPKWLTAQPDEDAAKEFKQKLLVKHGWNAIKAWILGIDSDRSMCVTWDEFDKVCRAWHFAHGKNAVVWRTMDDNFSGWLAFR